MWIWPLLAVIVSFAVIAVAILSLYVDDWQRDLTNNFATTSDNPRGPHPALRSDLPPAELANHTIAAVGELRGWKLDKLAEGNAEVTIHLIHTSPLLRLRDDIVVRISPDEAGSILRAESRSRLLKADLGQNPRNLNQLLAAVEKKDQAVTLVAPAC